MNTNDVKLLRLGRELRDADDCRPRKEAQLARARDRFLRHQAVESMKFSRRPWTTALVAALCLATLGVLGSTFLSGSPSTHPLSYTHGHGEPGRVGEVITARDPRRDHLVFSDGTTILLEPSARVQVLESAANGASVRLEQGRSTVSVVPRENSRWSFLAGPFEVAVTGTRFELAWYPETQTFDLLMREGSVDVTGPTLQKSRSLVAGQRLHLSLLEPKGAASPAAKPTHVAENHADRGALVPSTVDSQRREPSSTVVHEATTTPKRRRLEANDGLALNNEGSGDPQQTDDWKSLAADGDFARSLRLIKVHGVERLVREASASDLARLGDVARYAGDGVTATKFYQALRERFSGTSEAHEAAFLLGRLTFPSAASATWFSVYLQAAPGGRLAREALGRLLEVHHQTGNETRSLEVAQRYLDSYPSGPHAALARQITSPKD